MNARPLRVFLTGGGGFVGSRLLETLARRGHTVVALDRSGSVRARQNIEILKGDLLDPVTYQDSLSPCDVVLHLAASTGKASRDEHFRSISTGTRVLVDAARRAGGCRFLYVSSIAAGFRDTRSYYYAQAKAQAEEVLRHSGLPFTILRPTMILGPGSPILAALEKLALLPVIPIFGNGRTRVQPVSVDDVVQAIVTTLERDRFSNETVEVGGPDVLTIEELLQQIRQARIGRAGRVVHVPLGLVAGPLRAAESAGLGRLLPVSAGQLSSFSNDGVAASSAALDLLKPRLRTTGETLADAFGDVRERESATDAECEMFTEYLIGRSPDEYVKRKYAEAHVLLDGMSARDGFDGTLLRFGSKHRILTKAADAYARAFCPGATLRRKLVLLLAILESCQPTSRLIDSTVARRDGLLPLRLVARGLGGVLALVAGTICLAPARLAIALSPRPATATPRKSESTQ